ncbi:MAG: DUF3506 domain-containing protein [Verrucomicrobiales bacterium]|nr:DUF3506 domain-containing protein [Verrucomicrobiales bacterium]
MTLSASTAIPNFPRQPDNRLWLSALPTPRLTILSHSVANGLSALSWRSQASATYGIRASSDLVHWIEVANGLSGNPTVTRWNEPLAEPAASGGFYQIVQETQSIEGLWVGSYGDHGPELIRIKLEGDLAIATKLIGDPNVPSGQVTWKADVKSGQGQGRGADTGFVNPRWYPGTLTITNPDRLTFTWTGLGATLFRRVD